MGKTGHGKCSEKRVWAIELREKREKERRVKRKKEERRKRGYRVQQVEKDIIYLAKFISNNRILEKRPSGPLFLF